MPRKKGKPGKNVIHLHNCSGFQVGSKNDMTVKNEPAGGSKTLAEIQHGNNDSGILIVKNILRGYPGGIKLQDLRLCIREDIKSTKAKSFSEITGRQVEDFLKFNRNLFELKGRNENKFVRLRNKSRSTQSSGIVTEEEVNVHRNDTSSGQDDDFCTQEEYCNATVPETHSDFAENTSITPNIHGKSSPNNEDGWIEVKKKSRSSRPIYSESKNQENDVKNVTCEKTLEFLNIMYRHEDTDILFLDDSEEYKVLPMKCMLDIVCLWNTPQLPKSYIVIGVKTSSNGNEPIGVSTELDEEYWQNLFSDDVFTMKPMFRYHEINHDTKLFYLIQIACSSGQGQPSIVKKSCYVGEIYLTENELWYRKGNQNRICKPIDLFTGCIYQWFVGSIPLSSSLPVTSSNDESSITSTGTPSKDKDSSSHPQMFSNTSETFSSLWKMVNGFQKGSFVLVTADISNKTQNTKRLGLVPWLAVYDFDVFSCSLGIFNALQDVIENNRNLQITTWKDHTGTLSETGTLWCFMRGRQEISDSRTDNVDGSVEDVHDWARAVKSGLQEQCEKLTNFSEDCSPITFVIVWPCNEGLVPHICKFIDKIVDALSYKPTIILIMEKQPKTSSGKSRLDVLQDEFKEHIYIVQIRLDVLFHGISNFISSKKHEGILYELPKADNCSEIPISNKDAFWLNEDFEILYLTTPNPKSDKDVEEDINNFFKGGSLPWSVWYKYGQDQIEIKRDSFEEMSDVISPYLENFKTQIIYLYHAPGSGGSTLAKRILWKFRTKVPCMHLKLGTINRSTDIVQKVAFIHQRTRLPIMMLIDGEEAAKVQYLSKALRYTTIVYVKRYPYEVSQKLGKVKLYLSGKISSTESRPLASRYGEKCDETKRKALEGLHEDVRNGNLHYLFEFGMTVYHHEFKGIRAYVRGYLQLQNNPTTDLLPWQRCLAYLSLVYYYGQTSVPCQLFASLLGKPANYAMTLKDDFPHPLTEFIVNDTNDKRKNNIRICHFAVAQEILEQILTRFAKPSKEERSNQLSLQARRNLARFSQEFIEYTNKKNKRTNSLSSTVRLILARTFIFRDEKDMGENQEQVRRRPVLSKLMVDIPAGKPLFTERLHVLEKLVSTFPCDPSFQAHLGRFYAFCRSDEEDKVEKYFKEAISLCDKLQEGRSEEDLDDGTKSTLTHVYHMYGIVKHRYLSKYTGRSPNDQPKVANNEESFFELIKTLVDVAKLSCYYFMKSRELTPETREVYTYAYTGEIQVRLQMCDYVKRFFKTRADSEHIFEAFFASQADETSKSFIREGISEIGSLIHECFTDVELSSDDTNSLRTLIRWYNELFKKQLISLESEGECGEFDRRRIAISLMKLDVATQNNLGEIEAIKEGKTLCEVVKLYENIINEVCLRGCSEKHDKINLERDCREWIFAIRQEDFPENYGLEDVLLRVQKWYELLRSPTSTLYLFILQSLIGFDTDESHGKTECLMNAREIKEEMMKMNRLIIRPKYPREWLGFQAGGIKMLVPGNRHVGVSPEEREGNGPTTAGLKVCKGTIKHPNNNSIGGYIEYNMTISSVTVFFIPKRVDLVGVRFAGRRVEFNLAFSIEHGYEAFNVKLLKRHGCPSCSSALEFTSADTVQRCSCGKDVIKDSINELNQELENGVKNN